MSPSRRPGPSRSWSWLVRGGLAVLVRPTLWVVACRQALRLAPAGWWRRFPFLPLPDPHYLAFRLQTMYGDSGHAPEPHDLVTYLGWCRSWPAVTRRAD